MADKVRIIAALLTLLPAVAFAEAMQSTNYSIKFDSINSGGERSSSTNYGIEDTLGEQGTGTSSSATYNVRAGYQQVDTPAYISVSLNTDISMPSISGFSGGDSSATTTWGVLTDNGMGYQLFIRATSSPALRSEDGAFFADYTPAGADPDFTFTYGTTQSLFGYSPEGTEIIDRFRDDGSDCNVDAGGDTEDACYVGFTTSDVLVAQRASANHPTPSETTIRLKAGIGNDKIQDSGAYTATIEITAVAL